MNWHDRDEVRDYVEAERRAEDQYWRDRAEADDDEQDDEGET